MALMPLQLHSLAREPVPIVQEAGWASGPVWTGAENLIPIGIPYPGVLVRNTY